MALSAELFHDEGHVVLDLYPEQVRERTGDDPPVLGWDPASPLWLYWDGEKLERGEYDFLGVEVLNIVVVEERDLSALEQLDLPRVDCPAAGLHDATVAGVLRWAKRTYAGRPSTPRPAAAVAGPP